MHSSVYQITTEKVEEGGLLDEDTLHQGDCSGLDYCSNIDNEERRGAYRNPREQDTARRNVHAH